MSYAAMPASRNRPGAGKTRASRAPSPRPIVTTVEAMVSLFVESLIVAVITQRILGLR